MDTSSFRYARIWHGLTFAVAAGAVLLQLVLVLQGNQHLGNTLPGVENAARPELSTRLVRFWSFLTIWFNVIVAGTCASLMIDPLRDGRVWRALRADGVVLAAGGGLVHWFLLRPILDLHGADYLADKLLHIVVPVMAIAGWLRFGPRARLDRADLAAFLLVPIAWLVYTFVRGAIVDWYPYPFIDVSQLGYAGAVRNAVAIALVMAALAAAASWIDSRLVLRTQLVTSHHPDRAT